MKLGIKVKINCVLNAIPTDLTFLVCWQIMNDLASLYQKQLTIGCNAINCTNKNCRSCPGFFYEGFEDIESVIQELVGHHSNNNSLCETLSPILINPGMVDQIMNFTDGLQIFEGKGEITEAYTQLFSLIMNNFDYFSHMFLFNNEPMTLDNLNIDIDAFIRYYNAIKNREDYLIDFAPKFYKIMEFIIDTKVDTYHSIRATILLFLYPQYFDPSHVTSHVIPLLSKIMHYEEKALKVFQNELAKDKEVFEVIVKTIQSCLSTYTINKMVSGTGHPHSPENNVFVLFIEALAQFNHEKEQLIEPGMFVNQDFCSQLDYKYEYKMFWDENLSYVQTPSILSYQFKMQLLTLENKSMINRNNKKYIEVKRDSIGQCAMKALQNFSETDYRKLLEISFASEDVEDHGGVTNEFFYCAANQIFSPNFNLFQETDVGDVWFKTPIFEEPHVYRLVGTFVGLAVINSIALPFHFNPILYRKLAGKKMTYDDLNIVYPGFWQSLEFAKEEKQNGSDISDYGMYYAYGYELFGNSCEVDIIPNGGQILVTNDTFDDFIERLTDYLLNKSIEKAFIEFCIGFGKVCNSPIFDLFKWYELDEVFSGEQKYDWIGLKTRAIYEGGYSEQSQTIKDFWIVFNEFNEDEKTLFLRFVTGNHRPRNLKITISRTGDTNKLPTAHTCISLMMLPDYRDIEKIRTGMRICLANPDGFGFV